MINSIVIPASANEVYIKQLEDNGYTVILIAESMDSKYVTDVEWENSDD